MKNSRDAKDPDDAIDQVLFPSGKPTDLTAIARVADQYNLTIEIMDRVRARRQQSNKFFLAINSALVAAIKIAEIDIKDDPLPITLIYLSFVMSFVGFFICFLWIASIRLYKYLSDDKLQVIIKLEEVLPSRPFTAESRSKQGNMQMFRFTQVESGVPIMFIVVYLFIIISGLLARAVQRS